MLRQLGSALFLRKLSRDLGAIASQLARQNDLLTRLANHFAPTDPAADRPTVQADTGVSHLDPVELSLALDYVARTQTQTGHVPDDEEILIYLADEKTTDLHKRLVQREQELDRLAGERAWR